MADTGPKSVPCPVRPRLPGPARPRDAPWVDERQRTAGAHAHRGLDEEAAADDARRALRTAGIVPIEPDARVATMLEPDERVLTLRRAVFVAGGSSPDERPIGRGDLYVTDRRLLLLADPLLSVCLEGILEAEVRDRRLLLRIDNADGLSVEVDDPRVLRVQIGAARAGRRRKHKADEDQPDSR